VTHGPGPGPICRGRIGPPPRPGPARPGPCNWAAARPGQGHLRAQDLRVTSPGPRGPLGRLESWHSDSDSGSARRGPGHLRAGPNLKTSEAQLEVPGLQEAELRFDPAQTHGPLTPANHQVQLVIPAPGPGPLAARSLVPELGSESGVRPLRIRAGELEDRQLGCLAAFRLIALRLRPGSMAGCCNWPAAASLPGRRFRARPIRSHGDGCCNGRGVRGITLLLIIADSDVIKTAFPHEFHKGGWNKMF
jgi:hypothetical protein